MLRSGRFAGVVIWVLAAGCLCSSAEEPFAARSKYIREYHPANTALVCVKVPQAPKLDGTINDPLWQSAGKNQSAFTILSKPEVAGRQTMVYLCYDDKNLYVTFDCEEPELDQQKIDQQPPRSGDHVGLHLEIGDTRGRGPVLSVFGNRAGHELAGPWRDQKIEYKCQYGPHRWIVQMGIPFNSVFGPEPPLPGEVWGVKFTRFGKMPENPADRMYTSWPYIANATYDVVLHNAFLYFNSDNMLINGALAAKTGAVEGWNAAGGKVDAQNDGFTAAAGTTLTQAVKLRHDGRFTLEWQAADKWSGAVSVKAQDKVLATAKLDAALPRLDFQMPAGVDNAAVELRLAGSGKPPAFKLYSLLDDVPHDWICLTNNDWLPERNLKSRLPNAPVGAYTYLKNPLYDIGPQPTPPPKLVPRPDIGEDEFENFPWQAPYSDGLVPERMGLLLGSVDKGGTTGWIPFSKGSLTGDESWAGWHVNGWGGAVPHDILFDLKEQYYIRRIDVLQIKSNFYNLDVSARGSSSADEVFQPIYRYNGPGTGSPYSWYGLPAYMSVRDLDSVVRQVRLTMGVIRADSTVVAPRGADSMGVAEVWIWAEPKGAHTDAELKVFKPIVPGNVPAAVCPQLHKLSEPVIWPRPKELARKDGRFELKPDTAIVFQNEGLLPALAQHLKAELAARLCTDLAVKPEAEAPASGNVIWIGVEPADAKLAEACKQDGIHAPEHESQGYALNVTPSRVLIAGSDIEGVANGIQALLQWGDHDENTAFFRGIAVKDWPVLALRTVVPSTDHRQPMLPFSNAPANYFRIVNALSRLRYNGLVDWAPVSVYVSPERTQELADYAAQRMIDLRPALYLHEVPGDCIEENPDDQPNPVGGIGTSDGTWETQNICPSNPRTYSLIEDYVEKAAKLRRASRYLEVGYLGCLGGKWNVCRMCRKRDLSGAALYTDFLNRIGAIAARHGKTAVFTNAVMYSDAIRRADRRPSNGDDYDRVNRAIVMRVDRPMDTAALNNGGFWSISKPWVTPAAVNNNAGAYAGGPAAFSGDRQAEGAVSLGERADYGWWWSNGLSSAGLLTADAFWNGPLPQADKTNKDDYARFEQLAANACVRFNEQVNMEREYPSWRTGITPAFFPVDIRAVCTRSHIDDGTASGLGRSGPREGMVASGPSYDLRRVPLGKNSYADVPFEIIDPNTNKWKSMIVLGDATKENFIPGSVKRAEIPVGRKAASLCVLRCMARKQYVAGDSTQYPWLMTPGYVYEYADGTRCACDNEIVRDFSGQVWIETFRDGNAQGEFNGFVGDSLLKLMWPSTRIGWCSNTLCGAGAALFVNEFVNPFPEKEIKSLIVQLPNPEQRDIFMAFHEVILAVTGVEPTAWDTKFWSRHARQAVAANAAVPANCKPLFAAGQWSQYYETLTCTGPDKKEIGHYLKGQWTLAQPAQIAALSFRLVLPRKGYYDIPMPARYKHVDCKFSVSEDGKTWTQVAEVKGCTGMDGEHIVAFPPVKATLVKLEQDSSAYPDDENTDASTMAMEIYVQN